MFFAAWPKIWDSNSAKVTYSFPQGGWELPPGGPPTPPNDAAWHEKTYWWSSAYDDVAPSDGVNDHFAEFTIGPRITIPPDINDKPLLLPEGDYYVILNLAGRDLRGDPLFPVPGKFYPTLMS